MPSAPFSDGIEPAFVGPERHRLVDWLLASFDEVAATGQPRWFPGGLHHAGSGWERLAVSEVNRAHWDELAEIHGQDSYYDTDGFLAGGTSLRQRELDEVAAVVPSLAGVEPLHLQCHFGSTPCPGRASALVRRVSTTRPSP